MNLRSKSIIAAAVALVAQAAGAAATVDQPSVVLYGGGATFPINAYVGDSWLDAVPNRRISNTLPPAAGASINANAASKSSLFVEYALSTVASGTANQKAGRVGVSYCQGGSGVGRGIIINTLNATAACGDYGTGTPVGVSGSARKGDFGGSDAPLAQADVTAFNTSAGTPAQNYGDLYSQPVQIPAIAGSIAVVYNNTALGKNQLVLTRSDICGIFSGSITNWSQLTHTPKFAAIASKPIKVITRSESSGTTFSFTNFLSAACPTVGAQQGGTAVTGFKTVNTFASGLPTGATLPSGSLAVSGNGSIVTTVAATDGAIGYADVADTVSRSKRAGGSNLKFSLISYAADIDKGTAKSIPAGGADVTCPGGQVIKGSTKAVKYTCPAVVYNKLSPQKNLLAKGATGLTVNASLDKVLGANDANGRPTVLTATGLSSSAVAGCLLTVLPDDYAQPAAAATAKAPADFATYPIVAVSYLLATGLGNGSKLADLQAFLAAPYNSTVLGKVKTLGKTTGFAPLTVKIGGNTATMSSVINACVRG